MALTLGMVIQPGRCARRMPTAALGADAGIGGSGFIRWPDGGFHLIEIIVLLF
ncbi:hypothetical protein [Halotalea alkalilenta]|uniref:hypothetical protein n=1 Tax=Halotalea alkalilenta TaxID=376489 RepID=UPI0012DBF3A0|nr:hypothetical protein [Halotalea alkalilenta]